MIDGMSDHDHVCVCVSSVLMAGAGTGVAKAMLVMDRRGDLSYGDHALIIYDHALMNINHMFNHTLSQRS